MGKAETIADLISARGKIIALAQRKDWLNR
jgi:hypothetical protein